MSSLAKRWYFWHSIICTTPSAILKENPHIINPTNRFTFKKQKYLNKIKSMEKIMHPTFDSKEEKVLGKHNRKKLDKRYLRAFKTNG